MHDPFNSSAKRPHPLDVHNLGGFCLLHNAVYARDYDCFFYCLREGADVNITTQSQSFLTRPIIKVPFAKGSTPLHLASILGFTDMATDLLNYKADPNIKDSAGKTPIDYAIHAYLNLKEAIQKKTGSFWMSANKLNSLQQEKDSYAAIICTLRDAGGKPALFKMPDEFIPNAPPKRSGPGANP